jgi:hypothetical protein
MLYDNHQWTIAVNGLRILRNALALRLILVLISSLYTFLLLSHDLDTLLYFLLVTAIAQTVVALIALAGAIRFASNLRAGFGVNARFAAYMPEGAQGAAWLAAISLLVVAVAYLWELMVTWGIVDVRYRMATVLAIAAIASSLAMLAILEAIRRLARVLEDRGLGIFAAAMIALTVMLVIGNAAGLLPMRDYSDRHHIVTLVIGMLPTVCMVLGYISVLHRAISGLARRGPRLPLG